MNFFFLDGVLLTTVTPEMAFGNQGFLLGNAPFTTFLISGGKVYFYQQHLERLENSIKILNRKELDIFREKKGALRKALTSLKEKLGREEFNAQKWRCRMTWFNHQSRPHLLISIRPFEGMFGGEGNDFIDCELKELPFLTTMKQSGVKLPDYSLTLCQDLNDGVTRIWTTPKDQLLTESSVANLILHHKDKNEWCTPKCQGSIFKGIGLIYGLEGLAVKEVEIGVKDLKDFDQIFLINSLRGPIGVKKLGSQEFKAETNEELNDVWKKNVKKYSVEIL